MTPGSQICHTWRFLSHKLTKVTGISSSQLGIPQKNEGIFHLKKAHAKKDILKTFLLLQNDHQT